MKKLFYAFAFLLTLSAAALAQVHFNSGSAKLNSPETVTQVAKKPAAGNKLTVKQKYPSVRCRNGKVSYSLQNVCTGQGGPLKV